jgi:glucose/mannose-6-phosphate isomerase
MFDYDKSNFVSFLREFPYQIKECQDLFLNFEPNLNTEGIQNIVFAGMGGSAIAADLLISYLQDELRLPAIVNRNYFTPAFTSGNTLFIAVSYSGNTEETLHAVNSALEKGARIVGFSSGGKLEEFCKEKEFIHIKIPAGLPPRQALGYLFFPLLFLFERLNFISGKNQEVQETHHYLSELVIRYDPQTNAGGNLANHIAQTLYHKIPVIYSAANSFSVVTVRWRNQFNENSKAMAFSNIFPELNHNEIMGWEGPPEVNQTLQTILLRDTEETSRNKQRVNITKRILKQKNIPIMEVFAEGQSRLTRMFSLIATGDWASYYLAMLNEVDPIKISSIDLLKNELSKIPA